MAAIVDSSDDAIVGKTLDGKVTSWNRAAERMYGYSPAEVIGKPITLICPSDRTGEMADILDKIGRGERVVHFETMRLHKDGRQVPVSVTVSPVYDDDGVLVGASSIARDITEQHQAAVERGRRTDELERLNRSLEAFSYSVAHDLRAPLRALGGFSAALLEDYADNLGETGRGYAERIQAASGQMAMLIDDLLELSSITRAEIHLQAVDLGAEATIIAGELQRHAPGRRARFTIQPEVWVQADRPLIRTVMQNLLDNAWKFTSGQDEASIEFGTEPAGDAAVSYYVRDNGAGFDPAYSDKLFKPFQRLHTAREFPGTGVGLASVLQIVERHGGRVWAEGAVGHGATFHFTLGSEETR
jgi:PAS domain S-box-containing protein